MRDNKKLVAIRSRCCGQNKYNMFLRIAYSVCNNGSNMQSGVEREVGA